MKARSRFLAALAAFAASSLAAAGAAPSVPAAGPAPALEKTATGHGAKAFVRFVPGAARPGETMEAVLSAEPPPGGKASLPGLSALDDRFEGFTVLGSYEDVDGSLHFSLAPVPGAERRRLRPLPVTVLDETSVPPKSAWFALGPVAVPEAPPLAAAASAVDAGVLRPAFIRPSPARLVRAAAAALAALVAVALAFRFAPRLRRRVAELRMPPKKRALSELERLLERKLPEKGRCKEYFTALSGIMRRYFDRRHGIRATRLTTDEFLSSLREKRLFPAAVEAGISDFLFAADQAKFAGRDPGAATASASAGFLRSFLSGEPD